MVFGACSMSKEKLEKYVNFVKNHHPALDYTISISKEENVLDTKLSINKNKIDSTLYCKPTDSHSYLNFHSSHPLACKKGIPYSQFLRIRRICSSDIEFEKNSSMLEHHFINQGYAKSLVRKSRNKVKQLRRYNVLYAPEKNENQNRIVFPITYHPKNLQICEIVKRNYGLLAGDNIIGNCFKDKPMFAFKKDKSLKDLLVKSKLFSNAIGGTKQCQRKRCVTCKHINASDRVIGPKGYICVKEQFSCVSEGVVYVIECGKYGMLYVGETGRKLGDRFREHRRNVMNGKTDSEVAAHFCSDDHSVNDMLVSGLYFCSEIIKRKLLEQKTIARLGCVLGHGLNVDFDFQQLL